MEAITQFRGDLDMEEQTQRKLDDLGDNVSRLVTKSEVMSNQLINLEKTISEVKTCYVTLLEFRPVQKIVYAIVAIAATAVIVAMVRLVVIK